MKPQSRVIIHAGINFVTVPAPRISNVTFLAFQQAIISHGLEFTRVENLKNQITLFREDPSPLEISVITIDAQVGQVLVVAPRPKCSLDLFFSEAETAIHAFESVWPTERRIIIKADATIRQLYETTSQHAFQELWEKRLGQTSDSLAIFGRPIRGGGLRFILDPIKEEELTQIEVKIESYLADTTKIFVETQFTWPAPTQPGSPFDVQQRLGQVNSYIENQVNAFLTGEIRND